MPPIYRHRRRIKKKEKKRVWSAHKANLGARSLKPGTTRFFVGYKKHSLRLWLPEYSDAVLLVPLVSWAAPASVPEAFCSFRASTDAGKSLIGYRSCLLYTSPSPRDS